MYAFYGTKKRSFDWYSSHSWLRFDRYDDVFENGSSVTGGVKHLRTSRARGGVKNDVLRGYSSYPQHTPAQRAYKRWLPGVLQKTQSKTSESNLDMGEALIAQVVSSATGAPVHLHGEELGAPPDERRRLGCNNTFVSNFEASMIKGWVKTNINGIWWFHRLLKRHLSF